MEKQWYVVNTYSGHENKVKEKLEMRAESMDMQDYIFRVVIPEEKVIEEKDGVRKEKVKKMFPGYILVEMVMTDEAWYVVRNTPGVTGFVGSSGHGSKPTPLLSEEIESVLKMMGMTVHPIETDFELEEVVRVRDGAFKNFSGKVTGIDPMKMKLKVEVDMFGRETLIELDFYQVEKV